MENYSEANKRIAKNTILLYINLFSAMLIGLYTSRVVLRILGVSDYGLFNVVGGVMALFTFLQGSLAKATSRFINVELGKKDGDMNHIFNVCQLLHIILAAIIIILAETVGLWYIYNYLNVAPGKMDDAIFVYQISIITVSLGIINTPYGALFGSHERFLFTTSVSIINLILRLILVILMQYYNGNHLRYYAVAMSFTTVNAFALYHWVAYRNWPTYIKWKFVKGWKNYKEMLVFSNYNILSTLSFMARGTGSDLLINLFFGTAVNGAYAIAKSVSSYVTSFTAKFDSASGPQIIKAYSEGNLGRCYELVFKIGKFGLLLFEWVFFPLIIEIEFILHLWLGKVPEDAVDFCYATLLIAAVAFTGGGITQVINASGKVKWFKIQVSFWFLICVPIGYLLFKLGLPPTSILYMFVLADIIQRTIQLYLMKRILNFDSVLFIKKAYVRPFIISVVMSIYAIMYSHLQITNDLQRIIGILACFVVGSCLIFYLGLTNGEREKLLSFIGKKLKIKKYAN